MIVNNLEGNVNQENVGNYQEDVYMMKYNEVMIMKKRKKKMRSNVRKMFDGLYMKTETTYRAVQTRKDAKHIVKIWGEFLMS